MKKCTGIFLLLLCTSAPLVAALNQNLDFSGTNQFWKISEILEQDQEPEESEWTALFQSPGYRELMRREPYFREDSFRESFRLVFKPSQAEALKKALEKGSNRRLAHYAQIKAQKTVLRHFQNQLKTGDLMDEALIKARAYLPQGAMDSVRYPPVSFIFFDRDGRGYVPIIIDLAYALENGDSLIDFLAHEAHHYYRNLNAAYDEGDIIRAHSLLMNTLDQLQIEGIADQIDKHISFFREENPENSPYAEQYRKNVAESPKILRRVNSVLEKMADNPGQISELDSQLYGLVPQSGHPTGYYMARAIMEHGNRQALIDTSGNPFAFFYLYNKAALKSGEHPVFSGKAIELLRSLETTYCPEENDRLWIEASPQGLDFSAIEGFWSVTDILAQDKEPQESEWLRLFQSPAYTELLEHEGRRYSPDILKDQITLAFQPARSEELAEKLGRGPGSMLRHLLDIKNQSEKIKQYLETQITVKWTENVLDEVRTFLPTNVFQKKAPPRYFPAFFSPDLRYGYAVYIFDPIYGMNRSQSIDYYAKLYTLKYFHDGVLCYDPLAVKMKHAETLDTLTKLELSAFMENIMSKNILYSNDPARKKSMDSAFEEAFQTAPRQIRELDEVFKKIHDSLSDQEAWPSMTIRDFSLEGRPLGLYMAKAVIDTLGKDILMSTFADPFHFFRTYNLAAEKKPAIYPRFSQEFIGLIELLEREYSFSK